MNGILILNKEKGITSRDVVNSVSKKLNIKKVGHTGTLDPIATGLLIICVGSATKLVEYLTFNDKEYIATIHLGIYTDTLDSTGKILREESVIKTKDEIVRVLESFKGSYEQEVPIYSAVKINGKKLYEYARENSYVELPKRKVNIYDIKLIGDIEYKDNKTIFKFKCKVSKGTYIRSLIRDIANKLNTYGIMTDLVRTKIGVFDIKDSINIDDVSSNKIINILDVLTCKKVKIEKSLEKQILNGAILENKYDTGEVLFIKNNEAVALYKTYDKDNTKLKPYKMFKGGLL